MEEGGSGMETPTTCRRRPARAYDHVLTRLQLPFSQKLCH